MSQTFTVVNDEVLESLIRGARHKIVYVAPGVSTLVAKTLCDRFSDLGSLTITLILDVDPEIYRLGYGDPEGLDIIKKMADQNFLELRQQAGVRIGLLIADDETIIYSPTPRLIEAGSGQSDKPNAIVLKNTPAAIDRACASGEDSLPNDAEIGREFIKSEDLQRIREDLRELPPKKFDIARLERVFNSRIQYVELKVTKYKLSKKTASIPPDLMGLADDPAIQNRWRNAFRVFDGTSKIQVEVPLRDETGEKKSDSQGKTEMIMYGERELEADRRNMERGFFYKVPGYGVVIFRNRRSAFDDRLKRFERTVKDYKDAVEKNIEELIDDTINRLAHILLPIIREKTPERYLKSALTNEIPDTVLVEMLEEDLKRSFGSADEIASPEIKVQFKDIAYETIGDNEFHEALGRAGIPERSLAQLFSEYDAAPESSHEV